MCISDDRSRSEAGSGAPADDEARTARSRSAPASRPRSRAVPAPRAVAGGSGGGADADVPDVPNDGRNEWEEVGDLVVPPLVGRQAVSAVTPVLAEPVPVVAWSTARLRQLSDEGGFASRTLKSRRLLEQNPPSPEEVARISSEVVSVIFGRERAAILRVAGVPMQQEQMKTWKFRSAQQKQLEAAGHHVPADFNPTWFFYTFQFDRRSLLATAPLKIHDLEQWLWMHSRWVIADVNDMTKQPAVVGREAVRTAPI